jgi:ribosome-associated toxin RatA of RatAB toxin-antitoxin module
VHIENEILIDAPPDTIFHLAAGVERWPALLPHYRWVRVLERRGSRTLVQMAAHRDGIPVSWTSLLEPRPTERRVLFRHVRGVTRGMAVEWRLDPLPSGGTRVRIGHEFSLGWPLIGEWVARQIIGEFFVRDIAGKTLRRIKALAEQEAATGREIRPG